ncbi:MAG: serine/threonine protein phosphatase [Oscillatoriophycideae cyanobacterium NC_groundwater_1537_Pr4_S-0.65um_50_18]|nr:serine/threonine protein phosphatase [Oscillatoriophycideae cyanobacterium NC_groundwater_1537_Pr4_S-0.65um_50_18]
MASDRRIFIGDVHGHYDGLLHLLEMIAPSQADQIYFVGDLIDRGPKSAHVIQFVREQGYFCVMGNHEQLLLEAFPESDRVSQYALQAWLQSGGQSTVASYTDPELLLENITWLRTLPTHLDLGDVWLVHAGLHPRLPLQAQTSQEYCWIREEFHSSLKPYFADKLIITGHTITFTLPGISPGELARGRGWLDIDTGAYHPKSGWLTALDHTNDQVYQFNVFNKRSRVLPFAEAVVNVEPAQITRRRQLLHL